MSGVEAPRAVIYARVSTDEQSSNYSLPTQLAACREFAAEQGYAVLEEFKETCSGEHLDRPQLAALLDFVAGSGAQVVIVYDVDRLSRGGPAHHGIIQLRLDKLGARVEYVRGDYNSGSHEAMLSRLIRQTVAWYENQQRLERVLRGRTGMAKAGRVIAGSRPPYGYEYRNGSLAVVQELVPVVQAIFAWRLQGWSIAAIANRLSEERVPTGADLNSVIPKLRPPGAWSTASVYHILGNRTYTGVWNYGKNQRVAADGTKRLAQRDRSEWISVPVPAIVDEATFEEAQAVSSRLRNDRRHEYTYEFLLRGRVRCSCGYACRSRQSPTQAPSYHCSGDGASYKVHRCEQRFHAPAPLLDDLVWEAVTHLLLDEHNLREAIRIQRERAEAEQAPLIAQLDAAVHSIAGVEREMAQLVDLFLAGGYTRELAEEQKHLLVHKHKQLQNEEGRLRRKLAKAVMSHEVEESLAAMASTIRSAADTLPAAEKQHIIEILDVHVQALSKEQVEVACLLPMAGAGSAGAQGDEEASKAGSFPLSCRLEIRSRRR